MVGPRNSQRPLGQLLAELRLEAGWSQRELARRMGVGVATVSSVEAGRDPRWSTLRKFAEHLPGATAGQLLAPDSPHPEPASRAAWLRTARHFGFAATRACVEAGPSGLSVSVEGLQELGATTPLVRALRREALHAGLRLARRPRALEPGGVAASPVCTHELRVPVERLTLRVPTPTDGRQAVLVVAPPDGERERDPLLSRLLHPDSTVASESLDPGWVELSLSWPVTGLEYGLCVRDALAEAPQRAGGSLVASARRGLGLSLREVAERSGVGHRGVLKVEQGADARASTLRALVGALPNLAPQVLIPSARPAERLGDREEWEQRARCLGAAATACTQVVDLGGDGVRTTRIHTRALRSFDPRCGDFVLRVRAPGFLPAGEPDRLVSLEASDERVTVRRLPAECGAGDHELKVPGAVSERGLSFVRTYRSPGRCPLTATEARGRTGMAGFSRSAASTPVRLATHRLQLLVVFPPGHRPEALRSHVWPAGICPEQALMADDGLAGPRPQLRRHRGRLTAELIVRRPVLGLVYSVSWQLPA